MVRASAARLVAKFFSSSSSSSSSNGNNGVQTNLKSFKPIVHISDVSTENSNTPKQDLDDEDVEMVVNRDSWSRNAPTPATLSNNNHNTAAEVEHFVENPTRVDNRSDHDDAIKIISMAARFIEMESVTCPKRTEANLLFWGPGGKCPGFPIKEYLYRIVRYLNSWHKQHISAESIGIRALVAALCYYERLRAACPEFSLDGCNRHRFLLTSMLVASKFIEDDYISNEFFAKVGGLPLEEMNSLELRLCTIMKFSLSIKPEDMTCMFLALSKAIVI